jgi:hypothetical protein
MILLLRRLTGVSVRGGSRGASVAAGEGVDFGTGEGVDTPLVAGDAAAGAVILYELVFSFVATIPHFITTGDGAMKF